MSTKKLLILTFGLTLLSPATAYAYVDPGSGSAIITAILGGIAAITYTFRKQFYRLRRVFKRKNEE